MRYFYVGIFALCATNCTFALTLDQCLPLAAQYHGVPKEVLHSIINVESSGRPETVTRNSNRTIDVGLGGINSVHFQDLQAKGITPAHLQAPCNATFVSAWLLAKAIRRYGATWYGVATYHSTTPYFNHRYQILLHNDLVQRGVKKGTLLKVPPLKQPAPSSNQPLSPAAP